MNNVNQVYVKNDAVCDEDFNGMLLDAIPTVDYRTLWTAEGVDNFNIGIQNSNAALLTFVLNSLAAADGTPVDNCGADSSDWTELDDRRI